MTATEESLPALSISSETGATPIAPMESKPASLSLFAVVGLTILGLGYSLTLARSLIELCAAKIEGQAMRRTKRIEGRLKVTPIMNNVEVALHPKMNLNRNKRYRSIHSLFLLPEESRGWFSLQKTLSLIGAKRLLYSQTVMPIVETIPE